MKLTLKRISLSSFKGVSSKTIEFDGNTKIIGENGAGKTTIADAIYFVFANCNTALVNNPNVVPIGAEECNPSVEIEMDIDGKPLVISKVQKFKRKEVDGKVTESTSNTYSINGIDKNYKDFVADLEERGIDMDNFIYYSNPNAFLADTSKDGRKKIRNILFKMADEVSDIDIAKEIKADGIVNKLENGYKLEEVSAMAKGTIKKITEENGKDNSIINSRISGMLESKTVVDEKVLNQQKAEYESEIERIEQELSNLSSSKADTKNKLATLKAQRTEMECEAKELLDREKREYELIIRDVERSISEQKYQLDYVKRELERADNLIAETESDIENQRRLYKKEQDSVLDEDSLICPVCKREYDAKKIESIKADFEQNKVKRLKTIKDTGELIKSKIESLKQERNMLSDKMNDIVKTIESTQRMLVDKKDMIANLPDSSNFKESSEYKKISEHISKLEEELTKEDNTRKEELESQKNLNKQMLNQVISDLGAIDRNKAIDFKVNELREKRRIDEIGKAQAEKIVSQVEEIEKVKNERLAKSINEKFGLIDWHLWKLKKNGSYEEITEPYIDGKPMSSCANGSLITLAKVSICDSLGKFFNQIVPIVIEDASLFSTNTTERINTDAQTIQLIVADGVKDLIVEKGE